MTTDLLPRDDTRRGRGEAWPGVSWRGAAAVAWCAVLGWFAFVRGARVPLLALVDLGFHELGHLVMYLLPINEVLTAAMGSIAQVAVPAGLAAYFWLWRRDGVAAAVCLAWCATSLQNVSVYVADAPYERLELIGGEHDWANILGPDGFDRLESAATVAGAVRGAGMLVLFAAGALAVAAALRLGALRPLPIRASRTGPG